MVELLWFPVAIPPSRASRMLPVIKLDNPDTRAGPYRPEPESDLGCAGRAVLADLAARRVMFIRKASRLPCGDRPRPFDYG